jgi:dipeptidyl aminopeptidase/acylaminoacyl peptidase
MTAFREDLRALSRAVRRALILAPVFAVAAIFLVGLSSDLKVTAASAPTYNKDIAPILEKNCLACHSTAIHPSGLIVESYDTLMKGGKHGAPIIPHDAKGSRLVRLLEGELHPQMPVGADPLPDAEIARIKAWIDAGAEGPAASEKARLPSAPAVPDLKPQAPVVSPITSVKFSPDGKVLAVGGYRELRLIDPDSSRVIAKLSGHADFVRSIAFSPDGSMVAAAGGSPQVSGEIKIWSVASHELLKTLQGHKDCIYSIAWSPDGRLIASGSYDRMVKLWDVSSGKEQSNLQDHIDAVFAVAFSPDGKRLASASQDRTVKIWDVASGRRLYTLSDALDALTSLVYSPSGDQLSAAGYDKTIYTWRLADEDGHLIHSLIADEESVLALVRSPDGKTLVTASSDGSIRFRDTNLSLNGVIDHQPDWVEALDISPDGKWLAAGRYNGAMSLYDMASYKELKAPMIVFDRERPEAERDTRQAASR